MQSRMTALLLRKLHYYSSDVLSLDNPRTSITKKVPALELLSSLVVSLSFSPIKLHINNLFKEVLIKRNKKINIEPKWLLSIIIGILLKDFFFLHYLMQLIDQFIHKEQIQSSWRFVLFLKSRLCWFHPTF